MKQTGAALLLGYVGDRRRASCRFPPSNMVEPNRFMTSVFFSRAATSGKFNSRLFRFLDQVAWSCGEGARSPEQSSAVVGSILRSELHISPMTPPTPKHTQTPLT